MDQGFRRGFTTAEKTELWDRWQRGESLKAIGRAFGQAVIVDLFPGVTARWDSSSSPAPLAVGADALRTRGDIERHCGTSIGKIGGWVAGPLALDGEPGNQPERRL